MKPSSFFGGTKHWTCQRSSCSHRQARLKCQESSWVCWGCKPGCFSWEKKDWTLGCWELSAWGGGLLFLIGMHPCIWKHLECNINLPLLMNQLLIGSTVHLGLGWWCAVWQLFYQSRYHQRLRSDSNPPVTSSSLQKHSKYGTAAVNTVFSFCSLQLSP